MHPARDSTSAIFTLPMPGQRAFSRNNKDNSTIVLASFFLSTVRLSSSFVLWDFFKFFAFTFGIVARCSVFLRILVTTALVLSTIGLVAFFDEMLQVWWQREFVWHLRSSFRFRHS
ncbi:MAG: hypothetical protein IH899_10040 [Planctomycetes bacterium]|nr:hypothetical protein [Planctomycetota bacterium]